MGVDWRVGVALILSFAAREVFVSALAVVFQLSEASLFDLSNLSNLTFSSTGEPIFTTGFNYWSNSFFYGGHAVRCNTCRFKKKCKDLKFR